MSGVGCSARLQARPQITLCHSDCLKHIVAAAIASELAFVSGRKHCKRGDQHVVVTVREVSTPTESHASYIVEARLDDS